MVAVTSTMAESVLFCLLADSEQSMPTLRAALYWAIHSVFDKRGTHLPERVLEVALNILVDSPR